MDDVLAGNNRNRSLYGGRVGSFGDLSSLSGSGHC